MRLKDETIRGCCCFRGRTHGHADDVNIPRPVKHVWTDEEWEIFDTVFLKPAIVNDPAALAEYLASRLEKRIKAQEKAANHLRGRVV